MQTKIMTDYKCNYCKKTFKRERTLETHSCEIRRRVQSKDKPANRIAYETFKKFYRTMQGQSNKSYDSFVRSAYYISFVRFGNYCINTRVISQSRYSSYLINNNIALDKWYKDTTYLEFLPYFITTESYTDALERTILYSIKWGDEKGMNPYDLFRYGSHNRITQDIINGKISPWTLFNCNSGQTLLNSMNDAHIEGMWNMIDTNKWDKIFMNNKENVKFVKSMLTLGGW